MRSNRCDIGVGPLTSHSDDVQQAKTLLDFAFGAQSFSTEKLADLLAKPHVLASAAWIADSENGCQRLVCVSFADSKPDRVAAFAHYGDSALAWAQAHRVGYVSSMAVDAAHRGKGIGRRVADEQMRWLVHAGCEFVAAGSWVSTGPNPSRPLLEKMGFTELASVAGESYRQSHLAGRPCPVCGVPCACSGVLFVKDLAKVP